VTGAPTSFVFVAFFAGDDFVDEVARSGVAYGDPGDAYAGETLLESFEQGHKISDGKYMPFGKASQSVQIVNCCVQWMLDQLATGLFQLTL